MTIKEIVAEYWQNFEVIAFQAVKSTLPQDLITHETLTRAVKDGGYDGEFVLLSQDNALLKIIFEAKLRSDTKADLPLNDFAKALVIAIVRQADMIYIVTNLHFSEDTITMLERYADNVPLGIQLLNGYSVREFIRDHGNVLDGISVELRDFLLGQKDVQYAQTLSPKVSPWKASALSEPDGNCSEQARGFDRGRGLMIVTGSVGSGKSHYIEQLHRVLNTRNKTSCLIDLSKCPTYKDLFLEIVSKTLGLSLELADLMDEETFTAAFSRIGVSPSDEDDIRMLKFLFAKEDKYPYDYSILFSQIVKFYYKIFSISRRKNAVVVCFLDLVYAQKEVLQLLLYFLKDQQAFSSVLEVASDDFWERDIENWAKIKQNLVRISTFQPYTVENWGNEEACRFLRRKIAGLSEEQIDLLVRKFGQTPAELSNLVELIDYSNLYDGAPKELIYQEILSLQVTKGASLYYKCLEYMQYANSDVLYLYAFVFLLCGEAPLDLLAQFFPEHDRLERCLSVMRRSNLFRVTLRKIAIKNAKIEECFQRYCEENLHLFSIQPVITFVEENRQHIHLSSEKQMELRCRLDRYGEPKIYIQSLTALGDQYLKLGQPALAEEKYRKAYCVEKEEAPRSLSSILKMRIRLGLVEVLIWKIGTAHDEIEGYLKDMESLVDKAGWVSQEHGLLVLRRYLLTYQFYHSQGQRENALQYARAGVQWIETHDLYAADIEACGKMWRFYAVAVKESTQDIGECLAVFEKGFEKCRYSAKFLLGYIVHRNMTVSGGTSQERSRIKLDNYQPLAEQEKKLSVDEYLHYRTNVAALLFYLKSYDAAWGEYEKLLEKSSIFNITREEIRILNDMANICWIRGDLKEARKKYYTAKRLGEISGCTGNYWPILINLVSFEVSGMNRSRVRELHRQLRPYLQQICEDFTVEHLSFERREYCDAVLKIHLKNLWKWYQNEPDKDLFAEIEELWNRSPFSGSGPCPADTLEESIRRLELNGTIFDHNGLYLLKN